MQWRLTRIEIVISAQGDEHMVTKFVQRRKRGDVSQAKEKEGNRTADVFEVSWGALRGMRKKTTRIQETLAVLFCVICCSSQAAFVWGRSWRLPILLSI